MAQISNFFTWVGLRSTSSLQCDFLTTQQAPYKIRGNWGASHSAVDSPQVEGHSILHYHPDEDRARKSARNPELTGDHLEWDVQGGEGWGIYKPGADARALRNLRGQQLSCPAGKPREKHQHASALGWSQKPGRVRPSAG